MNNYICDECKYQFIKTEDTDRCPDCGKKSIREATAQEVEEFVKIQNELKAETK